jgi:hypothetical protein
LKLPRTLIAAAGLPETAASSQGPTLGVQTAYRPTESNNAQYLSDLNHTLGHIEKLERDLDVLDIKPDMYRTLMPMVEQMKAAALRLRTTYQDKVYRRPGIAIDARANVQRNPQRR